MKYRVENKYLITNNQILCLKAKLEHCMQYDSNMHGDSYLVRSLYFDDRFDSCLYANESGTDEREKFRIRTYNNNKELIHLELKSKLHGFTNKVSENLTREDLECYLNAGSPKLQTEDRFLKKKIYVQIQTKLLRPVQIIEYDRTALIEPLGNVRITFDQNICGTREITTFFDDVIPAIPILPEGQHILEIKYDEFLPGYLRKMVNTGELQQISFSKYYFAREKERVMI